MFFSIKILTIVERNTLRKCKLEVHIVPINELYNWALNRFKPVCTVSPAILKNSCLDLTGNRKKVGIFLLPTSELQSETEMASSTSKTKTLMDYFQPPKRHKASSFPTVSAAGGSHGSDSAAKSPPRLTVADDSSSLTPEEISRSELNKSVAKSKRNLALCSEKVTKAKGLSFLVDLLSSCVSLPLQYLEPYGLD